MSPLDANSRRDDLVVAGWQQGAVFAAGDCAARWNDGATGSESGMRAVKASEKLIVVSQTCDIAASAGAEPTVEALIYGVVGANLIPKLGVSSTRWFLVDHDRREVVIARHRLHIAKGTLENLTPGPWPGSAALRILFAQWLARRYTRPAFPDGLVEHFVVPTGQVLDQLGDERPAVLDAFNSAVHEIRINQFAIDAPPPYEVRVVLLLRAAELTADQAAAIDEVLTLIAGSLDEQYANVAERRSLSTEAMSVAEYTFATTPLLFDDLTFGGEELLGAAPLYNPQQPGDGATANS